MDLVLITIDCDYAPADDSVRIRPPVISDIHISNVKVGTVNIDGGNYSAYQAFVLLGPVASSYNGKTKQAILPIQNVSIRNCDFGTVRNQNAPWFLHHVQNLQLENIKVNGKTYTETLST